MEGQEVWKGGAKCMGGAKGMGGQLKVLDLM